MKEWGNKDITQEISPNPFEFATIIRWQVPSGSPITNATLSFLQPLHKITTANKNDKSSVFVLTYQGINVLFTGDATGLSLDNYVEKHQNFNFSQQGNLIRNRAILKNINLFVMPHHGSSTEDSFRWTLYVTKHSPKLLASVICGNPFLDKYKDVRNWVRDISWPDSMRNSEITNFIYYWSDRSEIHKKKTNAALFITGAEPCRCVYFKIQGGQLYKYDSEEKDFVHLHGNGVQSTQEDSYEIDETIPLEDHSSMMEEDENTVGEMQMRMPMNGDGLGMNTAEENTQKMEKEVLNMNDSFNPSPIKKKGKGRDKFQKNQPDFDNSMEMVEQNEIQENGYNNNAMSEDREEGSEMKEKNTDSGDMYEDDDSISSTFPSNVYLMRSKEDHGFTRG